MAVMSLVRVHLALVFSSQQPKRKQNLFLRNRIIVMGNQYSKPPQPRGSMGPPAPPEGHATTSGIAVCDDLHRNHKENDESSSSSSSPSSSPSTRTSASFVPCDDDWPYVWAMRCNGVLDWRRACPTPEMVRERMLEQLRLPVEITPRVYLGDAACVSSDRIGRLRELGITGVLNVSARAHERHTLQALEGAGIAYRHTPTEDAVDYPILVAHWEEIYHAVRAMTTCDDDGDDHRHHHRRIVVHCHAGQNRAGLVVTVYAMLTQRITVLEAVRLLRYQRGNTALFNHGFQEQLVALARILDLLGPPPGTPGSIVRRRAPPPPTTSGTVSSPSSSSSEGEEPPWWIIQRPIGGGDLTNGGEGRRRHAKKTTWRRLGQVIETGWRWNR